MIAIISFLMFLSIIIGIDRWKTIAASYLLFMIFKSKKVVKFLSLVFLEQAVDIQFEYTFIKICLTKSTYKLHHFFILQLKTPSIFCN